jgi:hypothetical protein
MSTLNSLTQTETINGKRYYLIGDYKYPSVTTVLGSMTDKSGLDLWRSKVGDIEADRISKFSANRGTIMHQMIEYYLGSDLKSKRDKLLEAQHKIVEFAKTEGFSDDELNVGRKLFYSFYNAGMFSVISKVISIEETLYSHQMGGYAGRVDSIYENTESHRIVLDFKSSRKRKKKEWIDTYFKQIAAYFLAYWEMYSIRLSHGEIWIAVENDDPQIFKVSFEDVKLHGKEFLLLVKEYHKLNPL